MKRLIIILLLIFPIMASAELKVGKCVKTSITIISPRLEEVPESGFVMVFKNKIAVLEYSTFPEVDHSKVGDIVKVCRLQPPSDFFADCNEDVPKSAYMIIYNVYNFRTKENFEAGDRNHRC